MKRLLALLLGGLGLRALLRRRPEPAGGPSPAADLRAKIAEAKAAEAPPAGEEPTAVGDRSAVDDRAVDDRRAAVHAQARAALDELREK